MSKVRLPDSTSRIVNVGRTGTGKTYAGIWHLSNHNLNKPWVVFNFKREVLIDDIPNAEHIELDYIPKRKDKGVFILNPSPFDTQRPSRDEMSNVEKYLWEIWHRGNCGIFSDEGYMMGDTEAFVSCLTQGRSLHIPMITNAQRPSWISRFVFSEAEFYQIFDLNDDRDKQTIEGFTPIRYKKEKPLEKFHSYYYDVGNHRLNQFSPVPRIEELYNVFETKLQKRKSWI